MTWSVENRARSVLELSETEARAFFLKPESYFRTELPPYFVFEDIVKKSAEYLLGKEFRNLCGKPFEHESVNYLLLANKDGRYAWRPFEIIHPVLYGNFVNEITKPGHWQQLKDRFKDFQADPRILCMSIPLESRAPDHSDAESQILNWWAKIEQLSIELALDYECLILADITDCYSQLYTHSVPWAVHTKQTAKAKKNDKNLLGNIMDSCLQGMRYGQTNGIPQGSVLMDFVAEVVLGYIDTKLLSRIQAQDINNFQILRYRDDYRIFVHSNHDGEKILKLLTEVLVEFGFKLNSSKTVLSQDIISSSLKSDKLTWICRKQADKSLEKHLLLIREFSIRYPNSGSLIRALSDFLTRLRKESSIYSIPAMVSITVDLACNNPRVYPICAAILSKLLSCVPPWSRQQLFDRVKAKFEKTPNTAYMEIWLQRVAFPQHLQLAPSSPLCERAYGNSAAQIWNSDWVEANDLKKILKTPIVDESIKAALAEVITPDEVQIFLREEYW